MTWFLEKETIYWRVGQNYLSEYVHYIYRRVVHKSIFRSMPTNYIGELSTNKTNIFLLETIYHTWKIACVRESVRTRSVGRGMYTFK